MIYLPKWNFEYGYHLSNARFNIYSSKAQYFVPNWSFASNVKQLRQPITSDDTYDVGAPTGTSQNILTQILVIQSDVALHSQVH